ncbi:hypothetical protein, partial [Paramuribaculum intestinale]|uniref:hypothetical protein n=1 Tax=Paramuribaculum intestinale TaxID=2094151 RepID=UPI0025B38A93
YNSLSEFVNTLSRMVVHSNGAQITISKATGKAVLTRNGKVKVEIERAKHSEIMALQKAAREL